MPVSMTQKTIIFQSSQRKRFAGSPIHFEYPIASILSAMTGNVVIQNGFRPDMLSVHFKIAVLHQTLERGFVSRFRKYK